MTGNIINEGTNVFIPIMDQLGNIASEFIPYMLYIALGCASVWLAYEAVRFIINYIKQKNFSAFYYQEYEGGERRNGIFYSKRKTKERKHIKRNRIKFFR